MTTQRRGEQPSIDGDLFARVTDGLSALPERRLMAAVLFDAVLQLARRGSRGAAEATRWIRERDDEDTPFSFTTVCDALGLDVEYLARGLLGWSAERCQRPSPLPRLHARPVTRRQHRRDPLRALPQPKPSVGARV